MLYILHLHRHLTFPKKQTDNCSSIILLWLFDILDGVLSLWKSVADSGLMGDVLSSLQTELLTAFKGVEARSVKANLQVKGEFTQWPDIVLYTFSGHSLFLLRLLFLIDAIILNSLCEMFGLLESVKGAVELRHNLNEENKVHNHFHGETAIRDNIYPIISK